MAFIQAAFFSPVLGKQVALNAIVPEKGAGPFPVLYLLHGMSDDHTIWQRRTRIEWYVRTMPLIVVMPDGFRGYYTDHEVGPAYGRYMIEDVLGFAERILPAARKRSGRCISGLSMGGYGSIRLALAHPELFVSAHSHSGAFIATSGWPPKGAHPERIRTFGRRPQGSAHDVVALARRIKRRGQRMPRLRLDCGTEDGLVKNNRELHAQFQKLKIPHEYAEFPGGHSWDYWDEHIQEALRFHARALRIVTE